MERRHSTKDPFRQQEVTVGRLVRGRMSSIKKGTPRSKERQRKQKLKEQYKLRQEAKAKAASDASDSPPEQVSLVPAPHARGLRCRKSASDMCD